MVVRTNSDKVRAMRHLYLELLLSDHNSFCTPPCRDACPTHIKIPQFLDYIAHKDYKNGVRKLREDLPFPAVLGRVCPRPCEGPCRRQLVEHPITICQLHRFMADQTIDEEQTGELLLPVEPKADTGKNPDCILYVPGHQEVYTFNGRSNDASVLEAKTGKLIATIPLGGKPEFAAVDGRAEQGSLTP